MLSGGLSIAFTQACVVLVGFLAQRAVLSTLTKDANGLLQLERRLAELVLILVVDFGLNGVVMRRLVLNPERKSEILSSLIAFRLFLLIPATLVCLASAWLSGYNLVDVAMYCGFIAISSRTSLLRYALELPYRMNVRFALVSATTILDALLFAGLIFLWHDRLSPTVVIEATVLSCIPGFMIFLFATETKNIRPRFVSMTEIRALAVAALPVLLVVVLVNIHDKIDSLMLGWFTTTEEVGVFGAAYASIGPVASTLAMSLALAMSPGIARLAVEDFAACRRYAFTALRFLLVIAICTSTVLSTLTPLIIELITKGRYSSNHAQFFLFLWMPVPIILLAFIQDLNVAMGNQKRNITMAWILFSCTVVLGLVFIPSYGASGAIIAKLLTLVAASSVAVAMFTRILGQPLPLSLIIRALALIGVGVAASNLLPTILSTVVAAITALAIVLLMTALLGIVDKNDVLKVKSLLFARKAS